MEVSGSRTTVVNNPPKKSQKEMTKKERRDLQEKQRSEKQQTKAKQRENPNKPSTKLLKEPLIRIPAQMRFDDPRMVKKTEKTQILKRSLAQKPVALFSHLTQYEKPSNLNVQGIVHPDVVSLGLQFSEFVIAGGNARCLGMLRVFQKVIQDYATPPGTSLQRHLTTYLSKQIDFLSSCRVLAASMKSAIRFLKYEISILNIDVPDTDAKASLCEEIDNYVNTKIANADRIIVTSTVNNIHDGDVILTFAKSSVVLAVFQAAMDRGIKFRVIVCDSRPKLEGKELLRRLVDSKIPCSYIFTNGLGVLMKEVTKVIIGASALFSNGAVMSRIGTAVVTMMAHEYQVPVIVCCETYKFSDTVRLDSFVWNEIGDSDELLDVSNSEPSSRLPSVVPVRGDLVENEWLKGWKEDERLGVLCLHYDVTPAQFITMVISEIGIISSTSVVTILRDIGGGGKKEMN